MRCVTNVALLGLVLFGLTPLSASTLTYVVTPGAGTYEYLFTLANDGPAVFSLFVHVPTDNSNIPASTANDGSGWVAPSGWDTFFSIGPDPGIDTTFLNWQDLSASDDIQPGSSLAGFGFTSTVLIVDPIQFALNNTTDFFVAEAPVIPAPEPATTVTTLMGMALVGAALVKRRRAGL